MRTIREVLYETTIRLCVHNTLYVLNVGPISPPDTQDCHGHVVHWLYRRRMRCRLSPMAMSVATYLVVVMLNRPNDSAHSLLTWLPLSIYFCAGRALSFTRSSIVP